MNNETIAFFAGTFDPFTIGHKSIVDRALKIFDKVVIGIGTNADKHSDTNIAERIDVIAKSFPADAPVMVVSYSNLTADTARQYGATALLRGVRSVTDYEYERTLADTNLKILGIDTVILVALPEMSMISSSMVRDLMHHGYDVTQFLPPQLY